MILYNKHCQTAWTEHEKHREVNSGQTNQVGRCVRFRGPVGGMQP